jgi:hypothetical protein
MSFISNQTINYTSFVGEIADEKSPIISPISLATVKDTDRYLDWIYVQATNGISQPYLVDDLYIYFNNSTNYKVRDPKNGLPNIAHMRTRINHIMGLPEFVRSTKANVISDKFLTDILTSIISEWRRYGSSQYDSYGILLNLSIWNMCKLIHNIDAKSAYEMLKDASDGSFLIRSSSLSIDNNNSCSTIFSMSYKLFKENMITNNFMHVRFLLVHGVGIYLLTGISPGNYNGVVSDKNYSLDNFPKLMEELNYAPPSYVSLIDLLTDMQDKKMIDLSKII